MPHCILEATLKPIRFQFTPKTATACMSSAKFGTAKLAKYPLV